MDEQEHPFRAWLKGTAVGRRVLAIKTLLHGIYYAHMDRYHQAGQGAYRFWTRLGLTAATLAGVLAAGFLLQPAFRRYEEHRRVREAEVCLARGDYQNAQLCARQALQLNSSNVRACRVMAQLADLSHAPQALAWFQRIVALEPTLENKLMLAAAGLHYERPPFPLTAEILAGLPPAAATNLTCQLIAASFDLGRNQFGEAERHFAAAVQLDPTNQNHVLNLAILRLGMTNEGMQAWSRATLAQLSADTNLGPAALRAMIADRLHHDDWRGAGKWSGRLLAGGKATVTDQLQNLSILGQLTNAMFSSRLRQVKRETATNAAAIAEVSRWMQSHGLAADDLEWLTNLPAAVRAEPPVKLEIASAYFASANWRGLQDYAAKDNWQSMEFLRFALLAHACAETGRAAAAKTRWEAAVNAAIAGPESSQASGRRLAELAAEWQLTREREDLLSRMIDRFPTEPWPAAALMELYFSAGRTADLHQLSSRLLALHPDEIIFKNNLAATALLLKTNLSEACALAAAAYTNAPADPNETTTYAYALHLQGRDQEGVAVLERLPRERLKDPAVALYYGVLLNAAGKPAAARAWLQLARGSNHLLPEEKQLLDSTLGH